VEVAAHDECVGESQIVFRKIDGHHELAAFLVKEQWSQAA
jgi:hypothetical protein